MMDIADRIARDDIKRAAFHEGKSAAPDAVCPYADEPARGAWLKGRASVA